MSKTESSLRLSELHENVFLFLNPEVFLNQIHSFVINLLIRMLLQKFNLLQTTTLIQNARERILILLI